MPRKQVSASLQTEARRILDEFEVDEAVSTRIEAAIRLAGESHPEEYREMIRTVHQEKREESEQTDDMRKKGSFKNYRHG